jgi:hypothetical protein
MIYRHTNALKHVKRLKKAIGERALQAAGALWDMSIESDFIWLIDLNPDAIAEAVPRPDTDSMSKATNRFFSITTDGFVGWLLGVVDPPAVTSSAWSTSIGGVEGFVVVCPRS